MKKALILFIIIIFISCKVDRNENHFDSSETFAIDSTVVSVEEVFVDESEAFQIESINEDYINEPLTYDEVKNSYSIHEIKQFIRENPNHEKIDDLERRIIDLEVENIFNDKNTGQMPSSEKVSYGTSTISGISIKNDTSCDLTIRYSGPESKIITISPNKTKSINLKSGSYRIAASACGYNYAGSENLNGEYTSSYYISSSRY